MRVILIKNVENLGEKGDVKEVANGYVRNFLLPNNLVEPATKEVLEKLKKQKELVAQKAEKELKVVESLASQIDGQEIEIIAKAKETGETYGSITPLKISQALKKNGFKVKRIQVKLKEPIKKLGEYSIMISFDHGLEAEIKVTVAEEKKQKKETRRKLAQTDGSA